MPSKAHFIRTYEDCKYDRVMYFKKYKLHSFFFATDLCAMFSKQSAQPAYIRLCHRSIRRNLHISGFAAGSVSHLLYKEFVGSVFIVDEL